MPPNIYITRLQAKNFGCLKDVDVQLTPLHAFIGPNDSGKSTLLRAMRTIVHLASDKFFPISPSDGSSQLGPFDPGIGTEDIFDLKISLGENVEYRVFRNKEKMAEQVFWGSEKKKGYPRKWTGASQFPFKAIVPPSIEPNRKELEMKGAHLVCFDPDALKSPSPLITEKEVNRFFENRGQGLAGVLDRIRDRGDGTFDQIAREVVELFPSVQFLGFDTVPSRMKVLMVTLKSGEHVMAAQMSDGLLFYLAFASIRFLDPVSVLLVEEPENGLHPARIADVVRMMREVSKTTQVLIATHSPLLVNELEGHEVTVVTRSPEEGTKTVRLCDTHNFEERSKVYAHGELWVSYANGEDEKPLLSGPEP